MSSGEAAIAQGGFFYAALFGLSIVSGAADLGTLADFRT
jgi:hypothetical protein